MELKRGNLTKQDGPSLAKRCNFIGIDVCKDAKHVGISSNIGSK